MHDLPWMGLGLATNLGPRDLPRPWRLIDAHPGLFDYVEYSAPLDLDEALGEAALFGELLARRGELPAVFHPVHLNLWGPELESDRNLAALKRQLAAVGSPWVGNDVGWWHVRDAPFPGYLYLAPPLTRAAVEDCAAHALHVQAGVDVPLLLENPAVMARVGELHVLDFMAALHERTGLGLILDLGHLYSHQLTRGLPLLDGLDRFPLEKVVEIHIAGGVVTGRDGRRFFVDDHTQPVREELFELLEHVLPRCSALRGVTFEADGHPDAIARRTLERLRRLVPRVEKAPVPAPLPAALEIAVRDVEGPWRLFEQAYAERGAIEDPVGMRAEADFRLAVVAQHLDRDWPLTRLLLAGTREGLKSFAGAAEFRGMFDGGGRPLAQAFGSWARRRSRELRDPGADAVLAFESWVQGALGQPGAKRVEEGRVGLAEGVRLASFPFDLGELLYTARVLRRHLTDRAWVSGVLEGSGLDTLAQVARRPAPGPWTVAVRRKGAKVEAIGLEPGVAAVVRKLGGGVPCDAIELPADAAEDLQQALALGVLEAR